MKKNKILVRLWVNCMILLFLSCSTVPHNCLVDFPEGSDPRDVGNRLVKHYLNTPHTHFGNPYSGVVPTQITYPDVCTWLGSLWFSQAAKDKSLSDSLLSRFLSLLSEQKNLFPEPNHVDNNVFGTIPLILYDIYKSEEYLNLGLKYTDSQWQLPSDADSTQTILSQQGYSWQTRLWIDDMFMITALQSQAYKTTGKQIYLDRMIHEINYYLDNLQLENGLFYHAPYAPHCWGRGNGWMAVGMTEALRILPSGHQSYSKLMASYRKMMETLLKYQKEDGLWGQLVDDTQSWSESSGSAMFTYSFIVGVKKGWLPSDIYGSAARKAWISLVDLIDERGDVTSVCIGTNMKDDRDYYLNRRKLVGDLHGQAPYIWCAYALLEK